MLAALAYASFAALGGGLVTSVFLWAFHARRSRVAPYAWSAANEVRAGRALLVGCVRPDERIEGQPVVHACVEVPATCISLDVHPFTLELPSGTAIRVEPEVDPARLTLEQAWRRVERGEDTSFESRISDGDRIWIEGHVAREVSTREPGPGYRGAALAWVLRAAPGGALRIVSERLVQQHAARARFHERWTLAFAVAAGAALALGAAAVWFPAASLLCVVYLITARVSSPWEVRRIGW